MDINPIHDLIFFLSKLEDLNLPDGILCDHNSLVSTQGMNLMILGLGLIESVLIYGTESSKNSVKENVAKIISYVTYRNSFLVLNKSSNTINALLTDYEIGRAPF